MPKCRSFLHWGNWIRERGRHVGFRSQKGLIDAIGCEQTTFYNWARAAVPPDRMQKSFDLALARALKVDRQTLFTGWRKKRPELVPITDTEADDAKFAEDRRMRDAIFQNARFLEGDSLRTVLEASSREIEKLKDVVVEQVRAEMYGGTIPPRAGGGSSRTEK